MIIFFPMIIVVIIVTVSLLLKSNTKVWKVMNSKRTYLLLCGYMSLLIIAAIVFVVGPSPHTSLSGERVDQTDISREYDIIYEISDGEGSIEKIADYKKSDQEYPFHADQLKINYFQAGYFSPMVIVDKRQGLNGIIKVSYYQSPTYAGNLDLRSYMKAPDVELTGEVMMMREYPDDITVINFAEEFTLRQFSKGSVQMSANDDIQIGPELIYIQVPKHVDIKSDEYIDILE